MNTVARLLATVFGAGRFPVAPGTFASAIAALVFRYALAKAVWPVQIGAIAAIFIAGVWASGVHADALGGKDPRPVVVDEVCGQWIAYLFVPPSWGFLAAGFLLFRAFDVFKPYPIRRLEALPAGWGIMADDVLAGIYAAAALQIYLVLQ